VIAPGVIDTPMSRSWYHAPPEDERARRRHRRWRFAFTVQAIRAARGGGCGGGLPRDARRILHQWRGHPGRRRLLRKLSQSVLKEDGQPRPERVVLNASVASSPGYARDARRNPLHPNESALAWDLTEAVKDTWIGVIEWRSSP
jgi:hypothetical protein